ncbi:SPFH domain-containing protein [Hydrogenoanaerobacterium sp.]|uniref:SPFH domain-containing protein n=1 Tax=Hydrogenoanaerobacterium sp. TaxID=2953763 RepID=UPI00289DAFBE|nr:SPFH domain-containing protein [Hydrogenoanaerobacterium sp.]
MLELLLDFLPWIVGVVVFLLLLMICWKRVPADKAMVITGLRKRVLSGKGGIQIPFLETSCQISLEAMSMTTDITEAPAKGGIFVDITGTAVVKVDNNPDKVLIAVEQFCNGNTERTTQNIKAVVEQILEGKLRGIVSTLTVEQINEDRVAFENSIEDSITHELGGMGLKLLSYTVLKIATQGGYLENRAIPQIAQSKSDADIASAERKRDTEIKTAEATREGEKARLNAQAEVAQSERDKTIRTEQYRAEQDKAKADADVSYRLQEIQNNKIVAEQNIELAKKEALVVEEKLVATVKKPADAEKYKTQVEAEANKIKSIHEAEARAEAMRIEAEARAAAKRVEAQAEADAIKARGEAEASSIRAKGLADAEAKDKLAEAMKKYGEAAVVELVISRLPEIMSAVAKPMEQIDKITVIDNGGNQGASKVAKVVSDVTLNGFDVLNDLTGVDVAALMRNFVEKSKTEAKEEEAVPNLQYTVEE